MNVKLVTQAIKTINNNFVGSVNMPVVKITAEEVISNLPKQLNILALITPLVVLGAIIARNIKIE